MKHSTKMSAKMSALIAGTAVTLAGLSAVGFVPARAGVRHTAAVGPKTTLTEMDWYTEPSQIRAIDSIFGSFEASHPRVKVSRYYVPGTSYLSKVLQEATAGDLPDYLMLDNPMVPDVAETGVLMPIRKLGNVNTTPFYKGPLSEVVYHKVLYGLPVGNNTIALFYNKKMLADAHITPPKTWNQLVTDAAKLTHGSVYGFGFSAASGSGNVSWQSEPFLWTDGGHLRDPESAGDKATLALFQRLVKTHGMPQAAATWTQTDVQDEFQEGRVAMVINGPWIVPELNTIKGLSYGIATIPVPKLGDTLRVPLGGETFVIPKTHTNSEKLAFSLLTKMLDNTQSAAKIGAAFGYVPSYAPAVAQVVKQDPYLKVFAKEVATARSRTKFLGSSYPKVSAIWGNAVEEVITGQMSVAEAAKTAESQVQAALGK